MKERVVEVRLRAYGIEGTSIPRSNLLDKVLTELGAFVVLFRVVEVDLETSALRPHS